MKHYIEEIQNDPHALSKEAALHIENCNPCRSEKEMMIGIESGIASIPELNAPAQLKAMVFQKLFPPAYRIWHLAVTLILIAMSPALLQYLSKDIGLIGIGSTMLIGLYIFFGTLAFLMLVPVTMHLVFYHDKRVEKFGQGFDRYLDYLFEKNAR